MVPGWELLINPPSENSIHPNQKLIVSYRQLDGSVPQPKPLPNLNVNGR